MYTHYNAATAVLDKAVDGNGGATTMSALMRQIHALRIDCALLHSAVETRLREGGLCKRYARTARDVSAVMRAYGGGGGDEFKYATHHSASASNVAVDHDYEAHCHNDCDKENTDNKFSAHDADKSAGSVGGGNAQLIDDLRRRRTSLRATRALAFSRRQPPQSAPLRRMALTLKTTALPDASSSASALDADRSVKSMRRHAELSSRYRFTRGGAKITSARSEICAKKAPQIADYSSKKPAAVDYDTTTVRQSSTNDYRSSADYGRTSPKYLFNRAPKTLGAQHSSASVSPSVSPCLDKVRVSELTPPDIRYSSAANDASNSLKRAKTALDASRAFSSYASSAPRSSGYHNAPSSLWRVRRRQQNARHYQRRHLWMPICTVPMPFRFTLREGVGCHYSQKFLRQMLDEKHQREESERRQFQKRFKANPVPTTTYQPDASFYVGALKRSKSVTTLRKVTTFRAKSKSGSGDANSLQDANLGKVFRHTPIPASTFVRPAAAALGSDSARAARRRERAQQMLRSASEPRGMTDHTVRWRMQSQVRHSNRCFPSRRLRRFRAGSAPDFRRLHRRWRDKADMVRGVLPTTVTSPFNFEDGMPTHFCWNWKRKNALEYRRLRRRIKN